MHDFKKLKVWTNSRRLVKDIYLLTRKFPSQEQFGLTQQIRRAAVSIPCNIAEGAGRDSNAEFARFLDISNGSACELETQMYLALDLGFITIEEFQYTDEILQSIQKSIFNLKLSIKQKE